MLHKRHQTEYNVHKAQYDNKDKQLSKLKIQIVNQKLYEKYAFKSNDQSFISKLIMEAARKYASDHHDTRIIINHHLLISYRLQMKWYMLSFFLLLSLFFLYRFLNLISRVSNDTFIIFLMLIINSHQFPKLKFNDT